MLFNSFSFAVFLPIVFIIYWACPKKKRWIVLLVSSYYFYMGWSVKYVSLILLVTLVSFVSALVLEKYQQWRKLTVFATAVVCMGILFFFKYYNFFWETAAAVLEPFSIQLHPITLQLILPVGISFYTFQTLSYVIDVYRGKIKAERNVFYYAAFVSFFPQLVAGPIERTDNLLPQLKATHDFDYGQAVYGLKLMAWGFFKKIVIADQFAVYVDRVFGNITSFTGFSLLAAVLLFTFQIYCDFSGYSDIARGSAKLFGIELMINFKSPYFSASIREFWKRWHISLSQWLQDYVYIPLGGGRRGKMRKRLNLMITFLASGLWHGANRTFVLWGGVHGIYRIAGDCLSRNEQEKPLSKFRWMFRVMVTFLLVAVVWTLFRADSLTDAGYLFRHVFDGIISPYAYLRNGFMDIQMGKRFLCKAAFSVLLLAGYDYISLKQDVIEWISRRTYIVRWSVYLGLILLIICWGSYGESSFIYFQF